MSNLSHFESRFQIEFNNGENNLGNSSRHIWKRRTCALPSKRSATQENNEKMERTGNHQETFNEVAWKKLKLDDDQLKDCEKQVKPNADIEETSQDEQAMETNAENNDSNSVIGNESELMMVSGSRQRSMLDEEKKGRQMEMNSPVAVTMHKLGNIISEKL
ncbi:Cubilin [Trichinella spiralis]|uniref:Cubilin n=1 Tax=Trichinella spiralis TaxID=6334 RepID=A0ABR3KNH3_TRISP